MTKLRRLYETPEHLKAEAAVIEVLCEKWKCEWWKLPLTYRLDFSLSRDDKVSAWLEIKCRNKKYPEMHLSLHKWMAGLELNRVTGLPFFLVYAFGEEIYWKEVSKDTPKIVMWGRTDRGDWQDTEPTAVFALSDFKLLA